ncbi:MAG: LamG domain-containing protein [Bryobacteraceae bacterium]
MKIPFLPLPNPMNRFPFRAFVIVLSLAGFLTVPVVRAKDVPQVPGGGGAVPTAEAASGAPAKRSASAEGGEPKFIEGKNGKAIEFGPEAAMIRIPAYPELRPLDGTTVCAWVRPTVESKGKQTVFRIEDGGNRRFMAIGGAKGIWGLWFGLGIGGKYTEISAAHDPAKLIDGQWHHVAGTFDGKQMRLYIDGKKVSELEQEGKLAAGKPTIGSIGAYNGRHEPFNGGIDDMRVYIGALTEEQVAQLVAGKVEPVPEAVVGHWKLDGNLDNEADRNAEAPK